MPGTPGNSRHGDFVRWRRGRPPSPRLRRAKRRTEDRGRKAENSQFLISTFYFLLDGCSHGAIHRVVHPLSGGGARAVGSLAALHAAIADGFRELVLEKKQRSEVS